MDDLKLIDQICTWATAGAYLLVLAQRLRNGDFLAAPLFAAYLAIMSLREALGFHEVAKALLIEPTVLSLRFCATVEALCHCLPEKADGERRWLILTLTGIGAGGMWALYRFGYGGGSSLIEWYASVRQYFHVALAFGLFVGIVIALLERVRIEPTPRNHYLILALHVIAIAVIAFRWKAGWAKGTEWRELHILGRAASCVCLAGWWKLGHSVERFNLRVADRWPGGD